MKDSPTVSLYRLPLPAFGFFILVGLLYHDLLFDIYATPASAIGYYKTTRFPSNGILLVDAILTIAFLIRKTFLDTHSVDILVLVLTILIGVPYALVVIPIQEQLINVQLPKNRGDALDFLKTLTYAHGILLAAFFIFACCELLSHKIKVPQSAVPNDEQQQMEMAKEAFDQEDEDEQLNQQHEQQQQQEQQHEQQQEQQHEQQQHEQHEQQPTPTPTPQQAPAPVSPSEPEVQHQPEEPKAEEKEKEKKPKGKGKAKEKDQDMEKEKEKEKDKKPPKKKGKKDSKDEPADAFVVDPPAPAVSEQSLLSSPPEPSPVPQAVEPVVEEVPTEKPAAKSPSKKKPAKEKSSAKSKPAPAEPETTPAAAAPEPVAVSSPAESSPPPAAESDAAPKPKRRPTKSRKDA